MRKLLVNSLKIGISAGIITYLLVRARQDHSFAELRDQDKHWGLLALAWLLAFAAVGISFVRWYVLVRAIDLRFRLKDAFRLGFLGYLLNFISVGNVGGDLFKAVFIAREQRDRRIDAIATVIVDRMIGMFSLLLLATAGLVAARRQGLLPEREGDVLWRATLWVTIAASVLMVALFAPGKTLRIVTRLVNAIPRVGPHLNNLMEAVRVYRARWVLLGSTCLMTLCSHVLFVFTIYLIASGLLDEHPSLAQHFVIVPAGVAAGALPLPMGALGAFEYVIDFLYRAFSNSNQGLIVALGYRLITVVIAAVGACFYLSSRREVEEVLHEAEAETLVAE